MGQDSKIEWTTHTFNPWRGCTKVSPGCRNCYAETFSGRNSSTLGVWGPQGTRVVAAEAAWKEPPKWNRQAAADLANWQRAVQECRSEYDAVGPYTRPRVFCASLADVFEDWNGPVRNSGGAQLYIDGEGRWHTEYRNHAGMRPLTMDDVRARLFELIDATPNLDWLLLTKRPQNVLDFTLRCQTQWWYRSLTTMPANVWLGTSVEDQQRADERIPELLKVPAAVRFLSVEPLLGPVDLSREVYYCNACSRVGPSESGDCASCGDVRTRERTYLDYIGWVIVGGESGPGARPCHLEWVRSVVQQCRAASVPVFVKQLGAVPAMDEAVWRDSPTTPLLKACNHNRTPAGLVPLALLDRKGGDMAEWPADLRVREFPEVARA